MMPRKTRKPSTKSAESKKVLNRRALLKKIGVGIALTAAGSTLDLGMADSPKKEKIKLDGDLTLTDLSQGTIKLEPTVTVECRGREVIVRCKALTTPTPAP